MIAYTETVYHRISGIILLRINVVIAVSREKRLHIVILSLMCHEEHIVVTLATQDGRNALPMGCYRPFHEVTEHQCRKTVERSSKSMVGVYAGTVAVCERQRTAIKAVERGRQLVRLSKSFKKAGRH